MELSDNYATPTVAVSGGTSWEKNDCLHTPGSRRIRINNSNLNKMDACMHGSRTDMGFSNNLRDTLVQIYLLSKIRFSLGGHGTIRRFDDSSDIYRVEHTRRRDGAGRRKLRWRTIIVEKMIIRKPAQFVHHKMSKLCISAFHTTVIVIPDALPFTVSAVKALCNSQKKPPFRSRQWQGSKV